MTEAAMSLSAAASGFVLFLLSLSVVTSQNDYGVTYTSTQICALKGSTVDIGCSFKYSLHLVKKIWFTKENNYNPEDLKTDPVYAGRVSYSSQWKGCTLTIRDLRESDSAVYKFRFETDQGGFTVLPGVTLTVTDIKVTGSTGRKLDCVTRCNPYASSYVWYKNGQQVNGVSSSSYEMPYDNKNSYSCALKGFDDFHSPLVCAKDQFCNRVNYSNRSICAVKGSSVDISCTYNNFERVIQSQSWFRSGRGSEDLREDSQYAGCVEVTETGRKCSTLRIRDLTESDSAEYHFKFKTHSFEWKSSLPGTTLTVAVPQVKVSRISVHESQTEAELICESSCSPAGRLSFVWFKNNQFMVEQSSYQDLFSPGDVISCAFKGHERYRSDPVYIPKLPSVSASPSGEIVEGSSVTLTCSSDAKPAAKYTWYKEQKQISQEKQIIFRSIRSSDSGEYYCTAENELGRMSSEVIFIRVKYAPKLPSVSVSPSAEIVEGSSVTLTCSSDANPAASYTWYKDKKLISQEKQIIFRSIQSSDFGEYYCTAENELGKTTSEVISINGKYPQKRPTVTVSPSGEIGEGSPVTLTCSTVSCSPGISNNQDSWKKTAAVASITVLFLAVIIICGIIFIRRKGCFKTNSSRERPDNKPEENAYYYMFDPAPSGRPEHDGPSAPAQSRAAEEQQDDLCYSSVTFIKKPEEHDYYNILPIKTKRRKEKDEEVTDVDYTVVRLNSTQR
ncbi:unnamed protein product [Oreochromis niloticus]|nr:unnamed protein product [Mustela putorius furo]